MYIIKIIVVDVGLELLDLFNSIKKDEVKHDIGLSIKEWFIQQPEKLILTNESILCSKEF
jgi:hypothetical protein